MMAHQNDNKTRAQMNLLEKMQEQQHELHERMEGVLARIGQTTEVRDSQLELRNNWAKEHNIRQKHRSLQNAQRFHEEAENRYTKSVKDQEEKDRRLRQVYKEMHKQWMDYKQSNQQTMAMMQAKKGEEELMR